LVPSFEKILILRTTASNRNFLEDDDTHAPPVLHDQSAEIGNVQNQLNSTQRSLQTAKAEREALEGTLANQAAQLSALQTQLASAKASYETETSLLNTLRDRHAAQIADIQRVREELIRDESDLSAIRVEKTEIEGSFLRDKEEVRDLNRRMAEVTTQIAVVKQDVEKVKKDAKQQKGLLAIAKKQLVAKESEKIKVDKELEEAQQDLTDTITEREEVEAEVEKIVVTPSQTVLERSKSPDSVAFAAAHPLPVTPDITGAMSPVSIKSNNPFERLALSSGTSTPRSQSPFLSFPNTSYPTPPGLSSPPGLSAPDTPVTMQSDMFSQASDTEPVPQTDKAPDTDGSEFVVVTPRVKDGPYFSSDVVSSPTSDEHFTTPPTSITPVNPNSSANVSSLDSVAAHFPAIDDFNTQHPAPDEGEKETDLSTDLQELEVNDTESESEDSHESEAVDHFTDSTKEVSPSEVVSSQAPTSFDDIFGLNTDMPGQAPASGNAPQPDITAPSQNGTSLVDVFGVPFSELETTPSQLSQPSGTSGLNSFDEALGKISNGGSAQPSSAFSFDSNFEDNFDFGTAMASSSTTFPPPPTGSVPANGVPATTANVVTHANGTPDFFTQPASNGMSATPKVVMAQPAAPVSFDEVFSSGPWNTSSTAPQPEKAESKQADAGGISFQDAFGGIDVSQALALDNSFSSRTSKAFTSSASPPSSEGSKPFPNVSPPASPRGPSSSRVMPIRSTSPPRRATSPPPRAISPKLQRPSSSSTKEPAHDKPPPPPRHSKLSVCTIFTSHGTLLIIGAS
jgi:epidermal growth factor receptor substrate 15